MDDRANVLYVGRTRASTPVPGSPRHKDKPWWHEVADWDYEEITGDLRAAEQTLVLLLGRVLTREPGLAEPRQGQARWP